MHSPLAQARSTSTLFALAAIAALSLAAPSFASVVSETEASGTRGVNDTRVTSQSLDGLFSDQSSNPNIFLNDTNDSGAPIFSSVTVNGRISSIPLLPGLPPNEDIPGVADIDFFSFNGLSGQKVFFDLDITRSEETDFLSDPLLSLFDSTGTLIALGDDSGFYGDEGESNFDPGSTSTLDSFIGVYTLPSTGRYFLAVTDLDTSPNAQDEDGVVGVGLTRPDGIQDANDSVNDFDNEKSINDENSAVIGATPDDSFQNDSDPSSGDYTLNVSLGASPAPSPVPEPGTMALMGVGLASLAAARKRKKNGDKAELEL